MLVAAAAATTRASSAADKRAEEQLFEQVLLTSVTKCFRQSIYGLLWVIFHEIIGGKVQCLEERLYCL